MSAPIRAARVVDGDTWSVVVSIDATRTALEPGGHAVTITLTPDEADGVACALFDAGIEPDRCVHDESFATVTVEGNPLCDRHARARDAATEATS